MSQAAAMKMTTIITAETDVVQIEMIVGAGADGVTMMIGMTMLGRVTATESVIEIATETTVETLSRGGVAGRLAEGTAITISAAVVMTGVDGRIVVALVGAVTALVAVTVEEAVVAVAVVHAEVVERLDDRSVTQAVVASVEAAVADSRLVGGEEVVAVIIGEPTAAPA